jgi:hypothetical protein
MASLVNSFKHLRKLDVVLYVRPQEVEAGGLKVQGQPGLFDETLSQKYKTKQNKTKMVSPNFFPFRLGWS